MCLKFEKILNSKIFYTILLSVTFLYVIIRISVPHASIYSLDDTEFTGVISKLEAKASGVRVTLDMEEDLICNKYMEENEIESFMETHKLGMTVRIVGILTEPSNNTVPNAFNYKEYLTTKGIHYTCNIDEVDLIDRDISPLYKLKDFIIKRIDTYRAKDYLMTMIVGDKSYMDEETMDNYRKNGVTHLFAISGMHIGLFTGAVLLLLKKAHIKEKKAYVIAVLFIWIYAFLTSYSASVLRAGLFFTFLSLFKILEVRIESIYVLLLTGVTLIFSNYLLIRDIGFIYSFVTTFGLLYFKNVIIEHPIIGTSMTAMMMSLPITIENFYGFNLASIFLNVIFVPFVSIIVYPLCLITFIIRSFEPFLLMAIDILERFSSFGVSIDVLSFKIPKPGLLVIVIYYLFLFRCLNRSFYKTGVILLSFVLSWKMSPFLDSSIHVEFLDVGQGDSILLRSKFNRDVVLIDTGGKVNFGSKSEYFVSDNTINYLYSLGIDRIRALIISHGDYDHMGDAINLVDNFKVDKVIFNCGSYNDLENDLMEVLDKKGIEHYSCIRKLNFDNDDLYFLNTKEYDNENDNSNVVYIELNGIKFLFMGDASVTTEKEILNKYSLSNIGVFKVGHHGSKTSSSEEFINTINPKFSIISVGKNNRYGHPNKEVLDTLNSSKIYRTDYGGSITFKMKKDKLEIETCPP